MPERILIGVAWPYANGPLHLGHIAGAYLPADVFARFHRMRGNEVLMVSGSDSHGAPITMRADVEGIPPREVVERYHASFLESWERMGITFDLFTTTMTDNHREVTHDLWRTLQEQGYIYESHMKVAYSPDHNRFLPGPLRAGRMPELPVRGRPRRPVRQLRIDPRPCGSGQPGVQRERGALRC